MSLINSIHLPRGSGLSQGTWVAQLVKYPTLGFSSGHDLTVCEFKPLIRLSTDSVEPVAILSAPPPSLSQNKS